MEDMLNLASLLGEQLHNLHLLSYPLFKKSTVSDLEVEIGTNSSNSGMEDVLSKPNISAEWEIFIRTLNRKKKDAVSRLTNWYAFITYTVHCMLLKLHLLDKYFTFYEEDTLPLCLVRHFCDCLCPLGCHVSIVFWISMVRANTVCSGFLILAMKISFYVVKFVSFST